MIKRYTDLRIHYLNTRASVARVLSENVFLHDEDNVQTIITGQSESNPGRQYTPERVAGLQHVDSLVRLVSPTNHQRTVHVSDDVVSR